MFCQKSKSSNQKKVFGIFVKAVQNNMCVSNQFFSEKLRARAKTKHKPEKIHTINLAEYYCFNDVAFIHIYNLHIFALFPHATARLM